MLKIIREIHQQPEHIRHVFMWTMVVITFSIVGFIWFRNTQERFIAALNPERYEANRALAQKNDEITPSPFGMIVKSFNNLRANISELIRNKPENIFGKTKPAAVPVPPQKLPVQ